MKGKSNLIFVIEDTNNNKFGGFVSSTITKCDTWINDSNSFLFSLKSNGRLNNMKQFKITEPQYGFWMWNQSYQYYLFKLGRDDIVICKKNYNNGGWCDETSYNYEGISNALYGKSGSNNLFTPKRFIVIQMK